MMEVFRKSLTLLIVAILFVTLVISATDRGIRLAASTPVTFNEALNRCLQQYERDAHSINLNTDTNEYVCYTRSGKELGKMPVYQ